MNTNLRFENLPNVLNAYDLASFLGISRAGAYDLMHRAEFPTLHINSRLFVTRDNLRMWIKDHTNPVEFSPDAQLLSSSNSLFMGWD